MEEKELSKLLSSLFVFQRLITSPFVFFSSIWLCSLFLNHSSSELANLRAQFEADKEKVKKLKASRSFKP